MASGKASAAVTWWTRLKIQGYKFVYLWLGVGGKQGVSDGAIEEGGEWRESEKEEGGEEDGMQLNCCGCTASKLSSQAGKVAHPPPIYIVRGYVKLKRKAKPSTWNPDWKRKRVRRGQIAKSCGGPPLTSSCDKAFVILPATAVLCQNIEFAK